VIKLTIIIIYL